MLNKKKMVIDFLLCAAGSMVGFYVIAGPMALTHIFAWGYAISIAVGVCCVSRLQGRYRK